MLEEIDKARKGKKFVVDSEGRAIEYPKFIDKTMDKIIVEELNIKGMLEKGNKREALHSHNGYIMEEIHKNAIRQGGRSWGDFYKETFT